MKKSLPEKNRKYKLTATDLSVEGHGIGHIDSVAVFCPGLLPDEEATVKITAVKSTYAMAEIVSLDKFSPARIAADCPAFEACGGCSLLNMSYDAQLKFKENHVYSCFKNIAGTEDFKFNHIVASPDTEGYRNKVQYRFGTVNGKISCGFYRPRSHEFVPIKDCAVEAEGMKEIREAFCSLATERGYSIYDEKTGKGFLRSLFIRKSFSEDRFMVVMVTTCDVCDSFDLGENVSSVYININKKPGNTIMSDDFRLISGEKYLKDKIGNAEFMFGPASFYQVNPKQTENLYSVAADYADCDSNTSLIDLYCGIGTIGQYIAKRDGVKKLFGIEYVKEATFFAEKNAEENHIADSSYTAGDCGKILSKEAVTFSPDVVVVDPPRKGCDEVTLRKVVELNPERIVYVSCNPATLTRDVKILDTLGYKVKEVTPVDMFPNTTHVETVVQLVRKKPDTYIDITVDMDELDLTSSEAKATYDEIKDYIFDKHRVKVSSLYIAQVKQKHGIIERDCYNNPKKDNPKQPQCPPEKVKLIEEALRHFKMIP